ncbi:MAG: hypothetical protein AABZ53_04300 [Planctomycetota bacterium]
MSVHVCYLQRTGRGDAIAGLRLVTARSDEFWTAPASVRSGSPTADAEAAGVWLAQKLSPSGGVLDVLCLDADGSACGWLSAPSTDPDVVAAIARQGTLVTTPEGISNATPLSEYSGTPDDASVAVLAPPFVAPPPSVRGLLGRGRGTTTAHATRIGVVAVNDVPARLLLDALDRRGVVVKSVTTVWHALCLALDPAGVATPADGPVVADNAPTSASLILDPAGRLAWAWSVGGIPIAAGSMRLAVDRHGVEHPVDSSRTASFLVRGGDHPPRPTLHIGAAEGGRLATEWLAWSAQLGRSPTRVRCLAPTGHDGETASLEAFGSALGKACPQIPVDLTTNDDPIGRVLVRLAERVDDAPVTAGAPPLVQTPFKTLAARPTRVHRRLLIIASLAITAMAAAVGTAAYRLRLEAGDAYTSAIRAESAWHTDVKAIDASLMSKPAEVSIKLERLVTQLRKDVAPKVTRSDARPILSELATLSMVLGDPEIHLTRISLTSSTVLVQIQASLEQATAVQQALREIAGLHILNWSMSTTKSGATLDVRLQGTWPLIEPAKSGGGGQ